jgi:hypothetical protein
MGIERLEAGRRIAASPSAIFDVLSSPTGHVAIDSSGMLQSAEGRPVTDVGDTFVVHMDREALGDRPLGKYDVTVIITAFERDAHIEWTVGSTLGPPIDHRYGYQLRPDGDETLVTSYYDWSRIAQPIREAGIFPVLSDTALRATLGILARTVEKTL